MLSTILPNFDRGNLVRVRILTPRGSPQDSVDLTEGNSRSTAGARAPTSYVVKLSQSELGRDVIRAKRALANNYINTNDINPVLLGQS